MNWKVVRLELASSWEFPRGSAGRSYLIRLPLADDGLIDAAMLKAQPGRATVRRYWPNQPELIGHLVLAPMGYAIRYELDFSNPNGGATSGVSGGQRLFQFGAVTLKIGEEIILTEPDGQETRFRVACMK